MERYYSSRYPSPPSAHVYIYSIRVPAVQPAGQKYAFRNHRYRPNTRQPLVLHTTNKQNTNKTKQAKHLLTRMGLAFGAVSQYTWKAFLHMRYCTNQPKRQKNMPGWGRPITVRLWGRETFLPRTSRHPLRSRVYIHSINNNHDNTLSETIEQDQSNKTLTGTIF